MTGYALIQRIKSEVSIVSSETISLNGRDDLCTRLGKLHCRLTELLRRDRPDVVAVEDVFVSQNARSALALGQARGAALAAVGMLELSLAAYPPATIKRAVAGHGRADKNQIQRMMQVVLNLTDLPPADAADAMAVAVCHALHLRQQHMIGASERRRRVQP